MIAHFYLNYKKELKLGYEGALAMYTGILTDTGRFRFRGVSKQTHEIAGMLLTKGVDVEFVDGKLSVETLQCSLKRLYLTHFVNRKKNYLCDINQTRFESFGVQITTASHVRDCRN